MELFSKKSEGCVLCSICQTCDDQADLVVSRGSGCYVVLNRFPYTSGHMMVVPNEHLPSLEELSAPVRAEMMELAVHAMQALRRVYHPDGFNVGANIGEAAGAGIPGHVHLHVLGRWSGDTNFLPALANTRVIPEALDSTLTRLKAAWEG
jgi:ATP adenylyltransferase